MRWKRRNLKWKGNGVMSKLDREISGILEYNFKDKHLLKMALTHSSLEAEYNYERLEFLGDAVLELLTSRYLYFKYPDEDEGELTHRRAAIVCEESLSAFMRSKKLQRYILFGKSEENSGGREKSSILCDVCESILGALFLDGGLEEAQKLVERIVNFAEEGICLKRNRDYKTELQVLLQQDGEADLRYEVVRTEGPAHDTTFFVELCIDGKACSKGKGKSKKRAEQEAARAALEILNKEEK